MTSLLMCQKAVCSSHPLVSVCRYYLELLLQEYYGIASLNIGLFQEESSFTAAQSDDAINEIQNIVAEYEAFDEEQVPDQDSRSELQLF